MNIKKKCEFCGIIHSRNRNVCPVSTKEFRDGNLMEAATQFTLADMYSQLNEKRPLILDISITMSSEPDWTFFATESPEKSIKPVK